MKTLSFGGGSVSYFCSFCPKFSDDVQTISAEAHFSPPLDHPSKQTREKKNKNLFAEGKLVRGNEPNLNPKHPAPLRCGAQALWGGQAAFSHSPVPLRAVRYRLMSAGSF